MEIRTLKFNTINRTEPLELRPGAFIVPRPTSPAGQHRPAPRALRKVVTIQNRDGLEPLPITNLDRSHKILNF